MASTLVAPKPADRPTSPGLISFGSDPAALDDYLNIDLFGAPPASRMSHSPASSHGALPVTPGTATDATGAVSPRPLFPALDTSPGGSLAFVDSYTPLDKNFGAFPDLSMMPGSSMDLSMGQGLDQYNTLFQDMFANFADPGPSVSDNVFQATPAAPQAAPAPAPVLSAAIDPQLFTTPAPAPAPPAPVPTIRAMTVDSDDDGSDGDSAANEEDDDLAPLPTPTERTTRRPRKNAAAAGGIAKRPSRASTPASVVPSYVHFDDPKPVIPPVLGKGGVASYLNGERIGSQEPDEWRPTPEEYKKLSSKEKRQLRNKISARNFRVRRKEYITTLESHIADRDQLISAIRSELSTTHNENTELRREIDALKRAIQEGRISAADTGLPPPRPLTPEGTPSATTRRQTQKDLPRANTQKDRSSDSSARPFWGGAMGNGGVTSVHATLIPDFPAVEQLSGKPSRTLSPPNSSPPSSTGPATPPSEGVNMNPLMNLSPLFAPTKLPSSPAGMNVGLDIMGDAFNQRTLDGFRAQLWGRMAKEAGARSVERERERSRMEGVEQTGFGESSPSQSATSSSPQQSSTSSPQRSSSPSQPASSSSTPPLQTISSSPSLSMLNSPASLRSLFESQSQPSLFQASSFGPGFGASFAQTQTQPTPAPSTFNQPIAPSSAFSQQNAASAQARAMLQVQWLALQQSRQNAAAAPTAVHEPAQQPQASTSTSSQTREAQLASFAQAVAAQTKLNQQRQQQQQGPSGLAASIRPAYLAAEKKEEKKGATPQQVASFATLVSQTLLSRMGSAFWDAFSGKTGAVDTDKVRRVLEGKAVVRVVDVEDEKKSMRSVGLDGLEEKMRSLAVGPSTSTSDCGCPKGLDMFSNLRGKK